MDQIEDSQALNSNIQKSKPHIIFILVDDVGSADFSYSNPDGPIKTPFIDELSAKGIRLSQHYVHPTCTPSRAALMTGKYAANVGLTFAMLPGAPVGLPLDVPTLPQLLRENGYESHMIGKWHLGNSKWAQMPVGRGFQSHVGCVLWDIDSYTKQMHREPWKPATIDWIRSTEDRNFTHFLEPRHATIAFTDEAEQLIGRYVASDRSSSPLFLYLAYTAAHSPLQPLPEHEAACESIPHLWRRQYCGMVVGLDFAIKNVTTTAKKLLGENLIVVVSSDNGGTTWWGGGNHPLRSGKFTGYEGGVKVPAFIVDFTNDGRYLGKTGSSERKFDGLFHISDWLPTLLSVAGMSQEDRDARGLQLDGIDQLSALQKAGTADREGPYSRRKTVLHDIFEAKDHHSGHNTVAFRKENYKLMTGIIRDYHWYREPLTDRLNSTDQTYVAYVGEKILRAIEFLVGVGPFDTMRTALVNNLIHPHYETDPDLVQLYDIENDPFETKNLALELPHVVASLQEEVNKLKASLPEQQKYWMTIDLENEYVKTLVTGDCSASSAVKPEHCLFVHPFLSDDVDVNTLKLYDGVEYSRSVTRDAVQKGSLLLLTTFLVLIFITRRLFR